MIKVVAKNHADAGKLGEAVKAAEELVAATLRDEGCVSYGLYQDTQDPSVLTMIEEWKSPEALQAHLHSDYFSRLAPKFDAFMTSPPDLNVYTKLL